MKTVWISRRGYMRLVEKVAGLEKELNDTKRAMAKSFATDNDIRENSEYLDLQNRVEYVLPKQLAEARNNLMRCTIFEDTPEFEKSSNDRVGLGSRVEVANAKGERTTYLLLGFEEGGSEPDAISYLSPLGRALMGSSVGGRVECEVAGRKTRLEILAISRRV